MFWKHDDDFLKTIHFTFGISINNSEIYIFITWTNHPNIWYNKTYFLLNFQENAEAKEEAVGDAAAPEEGGGC